MHCPVDNTMLEMSERQGIEIDYCPKCRGVWLDRGELDKIIEKGDREYSRSPYNNQRDNRNNRRDEDEEEGGFFGNIFGGFGRDD